MSIYANVRFRWFSQYDAYTLSDGQGGHYVIDRTTSNAVDLTGYSRDTDWNIYDRTTYSLGVSKILNPYQSETVYLGFYGGLCLSDETRFYPYEVSDGYYIVRDDVNEALGLEVELGMTMIVSDFHFHTGVSYFNGVTSGDWTFGIGYSY